MRLLALFLFAVGFVAVAAPARADPLGDVDMIVAVTGGPLSIGVPAAANLGAGAPGDVITAQLGPVSVTDARGQSAATWSVQVSATDFVTGEGATSFTLPASDVDYWSGPATTTEGDGPFVAGQSTSDTAVRLDTTPFAFTKTGGDGGNAVTWNPTLVVHVPATVVAGTYSGSVTHSVT